MKCFSGSLFLNYQGTEICNPNKTPYSSVVLWSGKDTVSFLVTRGGFGQINNWKSCSSVQKGLQDNLEVLILWNILEGESS